MPLHTPSAWTFWLSVALAVIAVISRVAMIPHLAQYAGWIGLVGYLVLWLAALSRRSEEYLLGAKNSNCKSLRVDPLVKMDGQRLR